jgi:hypothetical protein
VAGAGLAAAAHALPVAGRGQREGDLAYTWSNARTVGVAPNAVELIVPQAPLVEEDYPLE